jgi:hypothetical protein
LAVVIISGVNDHDEALRKARRFADSAYADALNRSTKEFQEKLAIQRNQLAARGILMSGAMSKGTAELCGKRIDDLVRARLDGLLEGYELYEIPLDDQLVSNTIEEVMNLKDTMLLNASKSITNVDMGPVKPEVFTQLLQNESMVSRATVVVHIERRRLTPRKETNTTTNITYQLVGHGSRVNVNSTDNSTNVVEVSEEQVFSKIREDITLRIPQGDERDAILERLSALEKAQRSSGFAQRYAELMAVAANHVTVLAPFLPALAAMVQQWS